MHKLANYRFIPTANQFNRILYRLCTLSASEAAIFNGFGFALPHYEIHSKRMETTKKTYSTQINTKWSLTTMLKKLPLPLNQLCCYEKLFDTYDKLQIK